MLRPISGSHLVGTLERYFKTRVTLASLRDIFGILTVEIRLIYNVDKWLV